MVLGIFNKSELPLFSYLPLTKHPFLLITYSTNLISSNLITQKSSRESEQKRKTQTVLKHNAGTVASERMADAMRGTPTAILVELLSEISFERQI